MAGSRASRLRTADITGVWNEEEFALDSGRFRCFRAIAAACFPFATSAEVVNRGIEGAPMSEIRPAPKSICPDQKDDHCATLAFRNRSSLPGYVLLMKSAIVDLESGTATLPLRKGRMEPGETVWSIMTDATDHNLANLHGVVYALDAAAALPSGSVVAHCATAALGPGSFCLALSNAAKPNASWRAGSRTNVTSRHDPLPDSQATHSAKDDSCEGHITIRSPRNDQTTREICKSGLPVLVRFGTGDHRLESPSN